MSLTTYTDDAGRTRTIKVRISDVARVRERLGIDLLKIDEQANLQALLNDPLKLVQLLHQTAGPEEPWEAFADGHCGDAISGGYVALLEAIVDFFPNERRRILRPALQRMRSATDRVMTTIEQAISDGRLLGDELLLKELPAEVRVLFPTPTPQVAARPAETSGGGSGAKPAF